MWNSFKSRIIHRSSRANAENFLLVTYDSCRYDSYLEAKTPVLDTYGTVQQAWSHGTHTLASHASMFQGLLPHVLKEEPYYNRFVRQLWRLQHRRPVNARVVLPQGSRSIIDGFNRLGYFTCGTAAMGFFRHYKHYLTGDFNKFKWTGTDARQQIAWVEKQLNQHKKQPFFAFINFGETHSPYKVDGVPGLEGDAIARRKYAPSLYDITDNNHKIDTDMWRLQVGTVEYLDERMGELLQFFDRAGKDVTVVMCGDHGDCFGENGMYGHGFYHPKVMEVPMQIFDYKSRQ